jgi:hypothetical protein
MVTVTRRIFLVFSIQFVAAAIGVLAAFFASHQPSAAAVYAANHCTRYAVTVSVDANCTVKQSSLDAYYQTPSFGWRDGNHIATNSAIQWELYYVLSGGGTVSYTAGYGLGGSTGGYGGAQARSACNNAFGPPVTGECDTKWHD